MESKPEEEPKEMDPEPKLMESNPEEEPMELEFKEEPMESKREEEFEEEPSEVEIDPELMESKFESANELSESSGSDSDWALPRAHRDQLMLGVGIPFWRCPFLV